MDVEGNWWLLIEEEPFNEATTPQITLTDIDVLSGDRCGSWSRTDTRLEISIPGAVGANPQRFAFGLGPNQNILSGALYEAFGDFPDGFRLGEAELPDHVMCFPAILSRVEPVSADIVRLRAVEV